MQIRQNNDNDKLLIQIISNNQYSSRDRLNTPAKTTNLFTKVCMQQFWLSSYLYEILVHRDCYELKITYKISKMTKQLENFHFS